MRLTFAAAYAVVTGAVFLAGSSICSAADFGHIVFQTIRRGNTELLASLLRQGTPVNLRSSDGSTPLMVSALWGDAEAIELLLDYGADPNVANEIGATALLWGAGDVDKVRLLLKAGADPNARSDLGNTPLIVAAAHPASLTALQLLVEVGADVHAKNRRGFTALRSAVSTGDVESVEWLLSQGAVVDARPDSSSDLSIAAGRGDSKIVRRLLAHGADPNAGDGRNALNAALLAQKPEIARVLIQHGAKLDRRLRPGNVPSFVLSAYSEVGDAEIARLMIEQGADLKAANDDDETALTWASKRGYPELIGVFAKAGVPRGSLKRKEVPHREIAVDDGNRQQLLSQAIQKSISLLQHSSDVFLKNRESCVSCHHQNLPSVAIGWARDRGFDVDDDSIQQMIDAQLRSWRPRIDRAYQMDRPVPVAPRFIGYGLLGFAALGYSPDDVTQAMLWYLAAIQQPDGHWVAGMLRPPVGGADIVATVLAMRSLQLFPLEGREDDMRERVARAREWLRAASPRIHQERVYRLLGLAWAGVPSSTLLSAVNQLLQEQRDDGGWAQLPGLESDAWATGQTLVALQNAGVPTTHGAYQQAIEFLLQTQFDDGSWYVNTRTWPFQPHFDSQFPHGKDQWVSAPATAWATMALLLATGRIVDPAVAARSGSDQPSNPTTGGTPSGAGKAASQPAGIQTVDFAKQIEPILARSCIGCHSGKEPKGGFRVTSRVLLLQGGESGSLAVVPNRSDESPLIRFVSGQVEDLEMPPLPSRDKFPALTPKEIALISTWIQQGAVWPPGVDLQKRAGVPK